MGRDESGALVMRINTAKNSVFKAVIAGLAALIMAMALAGCSKDASMGMDHEGHSSMASGDLSGDDIMFLQMMIPHHEQAIEMSKLAATNTTNPAVLDLAARIEAAQQPEIELMQKLLSDAGQSSMPGHSMGDNGMMNESDMAVLSATKDTEFDVLYLTGMVAHHNGAITMAREVSESSNSDVKTLANNIITSQATEIAEMTKLLAAAS